MHAPGAIDLKEKLSQMHSAGSEVLQASQSWRGGGKERDATAPFKGMELASIAITPPVVAHGARSGALARGRLTIDKSKARPWSAETPVRS